LDWELVVLVEVIEVLVIDDHLEEEVLHIPFPEMGGKRECHKVIEQVNEEDEQFLVDALGLAAVVEDLNGPCDPEARTNGDAHAHQRAPDESLD
jgi:hypothetical protein